VVVVVGLVQHKLAPLLLLLLAFGDDSNCILVDDVPGVDVEDEGGGGQMKSPCCCCCLLELGGVLTFPLLLLGGVGVDLRDLLDDDEDEDEEEPPEWSNKLFDPHDEGSDDIDEAGDISV